MRLKYLTIGFFIFLLTLPQMGSSQLASDVLLRYPGQYGYVLHGDYTQWDYGDLYTQSSGASLSVIYALTRNINAYGGVGMHTFILEDPAINASQLTQGLHLDYQLGLKLSMGFLFVDAHWRFNPVEGTLSQVQGSRTYEHENKYQFHEFPAKLGIRLQWNAITVAGGVYQHFVTGKQERDVFRVLSDTTREFIEHSESQFSELAPIGYFGMVNFQFARDVAFGLEAIYRDPDNFIVRLQYLKISF